jgi:hypothetical protein
MRCTFRILPSRTAHSSDELLGQDLVHVLLLDDVEGAEPHEFAA